MTSTTRIILETRRAFAGPSLAAIVRALYGSEAMVNFAPTVNVGGKTLMKCMAEVEIEVETGRRVIVARIDYIAIGGKELSPAYAMSVRDNLIPASIFGFESSKPSRQAPSGDVYQVAPTNIHEWVKS